MLPPHFRGGPVGWMPGLGRRHPDDAEERRERDRLAAVVRGEVAVDRPGEAVAVRERDAPGPRCHLVDPDRERLAGARTAHLDRAVQRVPVVQLLVALDELGLEVPAPAGVQRLKAHGIAGVHGQHRRQHGREVPVQRRLRERELVDHARGS